MQVNVDKKAKNGEITLNFTGTWEEFEEYIKKAYLKERNRYRIPGFRSGKAPRKMIETHYGESVFYEEAINQFFDDNYSKIIKENELEVVDYPHIKDVKIEKGEDFSLEVSVKVYPEVDLGDYKNIKVEKEKVVVTDEMVNSSLEREQKLNARMEPSEEVTTNSIVKMDIKAVREDESIAFEYSDREFRLSSGVLSKEVEENLIGLKVGDKKEFDANIHNHAFHAKDDHCDTVEMAHVSVEVKDIKVEELPELDDEFAKDVSEFETLDEFKEDIRKNLEKMEEERLQMNYRQNVLDKAVEGMKVELHDVMIQDAKNRMYEDYKRQLSSYGIDVSQYLKASGKSEDEIKDSMTEEATKQLKQEAFLKTLVKTEKIEVTDEDLDKEFEALSKQYNKPLEEIREVFKGFYLENLKEDISYKKAVDFLVESLK